ncbi:Patatin-like protein 7 [Stylosanthes scabra]|uniref:Patatin n=1 Tax=Stylosanthes scabra TaxID=79078 RepID=A0ABU6RA78_9FABA|nr:Patatin-like protein 7 [Stylosanthes scabra]
MDSNLTDMEEPSIDPDKLSYEIFSILETKFLFGYNEPNLWFPKQLSSPANSDPERQLRNQRGKVCILAIDGGGAMRGILAGKTLAYLENALKKISGDVDARIADYFDVIAGSGVGGIFAAMLSATEDHQRPIFYADDTWKLLAERGRRFYRPRSSGTRRFFQRSFSSGSTGPASAGLEKTLKETFVSNAGRTLTLKDTLKPVLIPCYDLSSTAPFLFSRADALESDSYDFRLWEVCMATSAEPGRFDPVKLRSLDGRTGCLGVDGSLAMVNPTGAAITHVVHNKQEFPMVRGVEDLLVLSLGTGQVLELMEYDYNQVKRWKPKDWTRPMARISGDGSADLVDQAVAMAFSHAGCTSNYVRMQANGSNMGLSVPNLDIDTSPANVKILTGMAEEMLKQKNVESVLLGGKRISEQSNGEKLDWFAGELVQEHQRRSSRIAPTVAFKQVNPKNT